MFSLEKLLMLLRHFIFAYSLVLYVFVKELMQISFSVVELISFGFESCSVLRIFCNFESATLIGLNDFLGRFVFWLWFGALLVTMVEQLEIFQVWLFGKGSEFFERVALRFLFHNYLYIINQKELGNYQIESKIIVKTFWLYLSLIDGILDHFFTFLAYL